MRILTPAELRQIEYIKRLISETRGIVLEDAFDTLTRVPLDDDSREFWLNILDIVLQANDAMKLAWRNSPSSNMTSEVLDKLRPNG